MFKNILVTGSSGFVGQVLMPRLQSAFPDATVHGVAHDHAPPLSVDLTCKVEVDKLVEQLQPDAVINLAAISHIPTSFENPDKTWQVNLQGTLNLLNALKRAASPCVFLQVGSSDCYGDSFKQGLAVTEETAFKPMNPYAASKAAADLAAYSYRNSHITVIRARPFNHTGAGQSNQFVVSAFAEQIAKIEVGLQEPVMTVGNLDAQRCFLHVSDVVDAYIQLLRQHQQIESGQAFNIAPPQATSIKQVLECLLAASTSTIEVATDPALIRPSDIALAFGDSQQLKQLTGWQPKLSLQQTLEDVLEHWRQHYG